MHPRRVHPRRDRLLNGPSCLPRRPGSSPRRLGTTGFVRHAPADTREGPWILPFTPSRRTRQTRLRAVPSAPEPDRVRGLPPVRGRPQGVAARRRRRQGRPAPDRSGAGHALHLVTVGLQRSGPPEAPAAFRARRRPGRAPRQSAGVRRAADPRRPVPRGRREPRTGARVPIRARPAPATTYRERRAAGRPATFLGDPSQRAMVRPVPDATPLLHGHVFRAADVRRRARRRARGATCRAKRTDASAPTDAPAGTSTSSAAPTDQALHEEKTRVVAEWVAAHGSEDQRGRHAAGLLADRRR